LSSSPRSEKDVTPLGSVSAGSFLQPMAAFADEEESSFASREPPQRAVTEENVLQPFSDVAGADDEDEDGNEVEYFPS
jgi:hypothetical protein